MRQFNTINTKKTNIRFALKFLCFFAACTLALSAPALALQKTIARVNGASLTEADLEEALNEIMPAGRFHKGFSAEKRMSKRPQALEMMIENELLYQEAVKRNVKIEEERVKKDREKAIKRVGGKKKYKAALKREGLSDKQYQAKLRKKYLIERIVTIEVKEKAVASEKEVRAYYEKNKEKYIRPEARRLTHILISVKPSANAEERIAKKEKAQEVLGKIKAGGDMSMLAWDYSNGPYRVKGGDLGLIHKGRLDPILEKEAFQLEPGQLSNIIKTRYGYHIVRVEEIKASEQLSLEQVSKKIKEELTEKNETRLREAFIEKLRAQAQVEIF
jgi:peptidyl-prolyl cis-trans isomerase C